MSDKDDDHMHSTFIPPEIAQNFANAIMSGEHKMAALLAALTHCLQQWGTEIDQDVGRRIDVMIKSYRGPIERLTPEEAKGMFDRKEIFPACFSGGRPGLGHVPRLCIYQHRKKKGDFIWAVWRDVHKVVAIAQTPDAPWSEIIRAGRCKNFTDALHCGVAACMEIEGVHVSDASQVEEQEVGLMQ